jgi:hypothetical protein
MKPKKLEAGKCSTLKRNGKCIEEILITKSEGKISHEISRNIYEDNVTNKFKGKECDDCIYVCSEKRWALIDTRVNLVIP